MLMAFIRFKAHHTTAVLSLKLLAHLMLTHPTFAARFRALSGWHMLETALPAFHEVADVYYVLLALLLDQPIALLPDTLRLDAQSLAAQFRVCCLLFVCCLFIVVVGCGLRVVGCCWLLFEVLIVVLLYRMSRMCQCRRHSAC